MKLELLIQPACLLGSPLGFIKVGDLIEISDRNGQEWIRKGRGRAVPEHEDRQVVGRIVHESEINGRLQDKSR